MCKHRFVPWVTCTLVAFVISSVVVFSSEKAQQLPVEVISEAPPVLGSKFKCADMIRVVNVLRRQGKDAAIQSLDEYLKQSPNDIRVHLICRCLFVNPQGWTPPRLGQPQPKVAENGVMHYHAFPLAFSNRVPFLLIMDYQFVGKQEMPRKSLMKCRSLNLIESDLPADGYTEAARLLVASDGFRELYPDKKERNRMVAIILEQAANDAGKHKESRNGDAAAL
jgi:hypothetical protein